MVLFSKLLRATETQTTKAALSRSCQMVCENCSANTLQKNDISRPDTNFVQRYLFMLLRIFHPTILPQSLLFLAAFTMSSLLRTHGRWLLVALSQVHTRSKTRNIVQPWKTAAMLYGLRRGGSLDLLHWRHGEASISCEQDFYDPWSEANPFKYLQHRPAPAKCRQWPQ